MLPSYASERRSGYGENHRWYRLRVCPCLIPARLYTTLGMVSEKTSSEKEKAGEGLLLILKSSHTGKNSEHKREG